MDSREKKQVVLVVEDEKVNRKILNKILSEQYLVLEAENGETAWKILTDETKNIDAVVTDIVMPVMDGYALLSKIQKNGMAELPVIVTTGSSDAESEQKVLDAGAWDFVPKPYNANVLLSRLRNAIARRQVSYLERMQKMAAHDSLTGLYNRSKMFEKIQTMLRDNPNEKFAFMRIDIDHFALYNTSFGENEGDNLLKYLAGCVQEFSAKYPLYVCGRISADVFCVCFSYDGNAESVRKNTSGIQQKLSEYRKDYLIEISAGFYIIDDTTLGPDDYYFRASIATQKCKNQYETYMAVYDADSVQRYATEIEITNDMQTALDEEQFVIYMQPKIRLSTEKACGAEALVRWIHPVKGMISPGMFIPVFEKNGFISKLDYYVWEHTCIILRKWIDEGKNPYPVSVNISRISLYNPQLPSLITELVRKYDLAPSILQLEITESAYMTNPDLMKENIHNLRLAGFTILMDDFGSGFSSLNTLKEIEVDILKIDMKFLPVDEEVEKGEIILASVIKMANWLGMSVVTEGVETRRQRDFLEGAGCDCVQGYFYSKPISEAEYTEKYLGRNNEAAVQKDDAGKKITPKHNMTVLIIDDSEIDGVILKENFDDLYHIHVCDNAESGLAYLKTNKNKIKLIMVDNVMPGMSGLDFLKYCQQDSSLSAIPKIMITANDTIEDQVEAFKEGAYDYITKPLIKEVVRARVNHVMELSRRTSIFDVVGQGYGQFLEHDSETNLLSKRSFHEMSTRVLEALPENDEALMVLDIDDFKHVNDTNGHLIGDKVIECVAKELQKAFRKTDIIGRFGGDEFAVFMTNIPSRATAKRKAAEISKNVLLNCSKLLNINASVSIGVSFYEPDDTIDIMFARADQALYEAKKSGKGKAVVYGEEVPPIIDDDKPVVLICGEDPQIYSNIALAYGESAAFAQISSFEELIHCFEKYENRIHVVCLDMQKKIMHDSDKFYQYILNMGGGSKIPILAVCKEGNLEQMRSAMELELFSLLLLPAPEDTIQYRLSQAILSYGQEKSK